VAAPPLSELRSEVEQHRADENEGSSRVIQTLHGKIDAQIAGNGNGATQEADVVADEESAKAEVLRLTKLLKGLSDEEIKSIKNERGLSIDKAIEKAGGVENLTPEQVSKAVGLIEKHNAAKEKA